MAELGYRMVEPKGEARLTLLALHGRGSNPDDMLGLAPYFGESVRIVAPAGPLSMGSESYAWYEVAERGAPRQPGFSAHLEQLDRFLHEVQRRYGTVAKRLVVIGFSQGAVMTYALARMRPQAFAGAVALSGYLPEPDGQALDWTPLSSVPVMATHGTVDPTIPVEMARQAGKILAAAGVQVTYREYPMGHHVTPESMQAVQEFLRGVEAGVRE